MTLLYPVRIPSPAILSLTALLKHSKSGTKGSYKTDSVTLLTGSWTLNDALIGELDADKKEGLYAVRLRTGSISMNFDVAGVRMLYVKHARYGNDAPSEWKLEISRDGGLSYEQVGNTIMETNTSLVLDSFAVQAQGKVRFRISKQGTARVNLDDLTFRGVGSPGIIVGQPDTTDADSSATPEPGAQRGTPDGNLPDAPLPRARTATCSSEILQTLRPVSCSQRIT
ncbi:hypothetical protein [Arcticibacter sp. MXS-1]|uniref:hypothetical protein n=1 Tax=Arcticibacter sp. MXS-1 TaxID=3341726 RepID=UPI0035A947C7